MWDDLPHHGSEARRDLVQSPALERAVGSVRGLDVLDVGCGTGYFTRVMARKGAHATGVDWSGGMLRRAREEERGSPLGIVYRRLDAARIARAWTQPAFDRVVACMSLMDMPDPAAVIRGAARVLRRDGRFVFSVAHPVHTAPTSGWLHPRRAELGSWTLDHYFDEGPHAFEVCFAGLRQPFNGIHWHYTLTTWMAMIAAGGFYVHSLVEPRPSAGPDGAHPEGSDRIPFWMVVECRRRPSERGARRVRG
jgi:SAM-dependent methyltransferase